LVTLWTNSNYQDQVHGENISMKHNGTMRKPEVPDFSSGGGLLSYTMPHKRKIVF
jgi:hypothetical protein